MCGINGIFSTKQSTDLTLEIKKMNNKIIHRGPDSTGEYINSGKKYKVAMGMRRLSIIDLKNGSQPIFSDDKSKIIVFNGEIYNFKKLKKELIDKGYTFRTNSDTEVILKLYESEGPDSFGKLDGMYAFSIYDKNIDKLFIARDYFGEKPLYFHQGDGKFIWASELKSLISVLKKKPQIDLNGLCLFFQLTYIPAPFTIYNGVKKLEPNKLIELDLKTNNLTITKIKRTKNKFLIPNKYEAIKMTHDLVNESVESRSISDVPLGTFLSGGVDSSIVTLCLANQNSEKIDTFSIGFNKKSFDESDKSRLVSKLINSNHHEFIISEKMVENNLDEIILNFDEPFADSSALATSLVSKKTKNYVKVALTGDGGDEVFGGYNKYYVGYLNKLYTGIFPKKIHDYSLGLLNYLLKNKDDSRGYSHKLNKLLNSVDYNNDYYYNIISLAFKERELSQFFNKNFYNPNSLGYFKEIIRHDKKTITDFRKIDKLISLEGDMLVKVDRTSMFASLECRAPFLNKKLWDFTNQLPEKYLVNGFDKKHILKEAFKKYFPKNFLNKSKKGFEVPVGDWLRVNLSSELKSFINKDFIKKQNIFQHLNIKKLILNHLNSNSDNTFKAWTFYCFQKWYVNNYLK